MKKSKLILFLISVMFLFPSFILADNRGDMIESAKAVQAKLASINSLNKLKLGKDLKTNLNSVLKEAQDYADVLLVSGEIEKYEVTNTSIVIRHKVGLTFVFSPDIEGTYSGASLDDKQINMYIIQPWYDDVVAIEDKVMKLPDNAENEAVLLEMSANFLTNRFSNVKYSLDNFIKNREIFESDITKIGPNQIVLWQGHGSWAGEEKHSILWTKRDFDWDKFENDPKYRDDCDNNRIVADIYNEAITSKYIDKYGGDMSGSYIYLGPCASGYDPVLAESFLNKGAAAVIANSEVIQSRYGDIMQYTTTKLLSEINPNTNDYYTLGEALDKAKEMYGKDDSYQYTMGLGAEPLLFGNKNYQIKSLKSNEIVPNTKDNIITYVGLGLVAIAGIIIVLIIFFKKKKTK